MTNILQRLPTACPYNLAQRFLADLLAAYVDSGRIDTIDLTAPVEILKQRNIRLVKAVDVRYGRGKDPMHFDEVWTVAWEPHGGGPFPGFNGQLTVRADEDYTSCILELAGEYEPPLGPVGAAFDALVGAHLAAATASDLLRAIGARLVAMYRENEASKKART
jgi:hypothetical protein